MARKADTRAVGLDVGLAFIKWLTGAENLHYGLWDGLDVTAANLRRAQDAYTEKLFRLLPEGRLRILDIGGGAGETAKKLLALGHEVEIVVPSAFLASRCRENAPGACVHECRFEDFEGEGGFDICLFSESFQYIPVSIALEKSSALLKGGGEIIIADCFRSDAFSAGGTKATVGGGHHVRLFLATLEAMPLEILHEEDITAAVAPSVELEQGFFNVLGYGIGRVDEELARSRPKLRWALRRAVRLLLSERKRTRLDQRLNQRTRTAEAFEKYNRYLMLKLGPKGGG